MTPAASRTPVAIRVFPTLGSYRAIRPRPLGAVPIGHCGPVTDRGLLGSIPHLYHDLGILPFAGCTDQQITRIGDILSLIVGLGGPAAIATRLEWTGKIVKQRMPPFTKSAIQKSLDPSTAGTIKARHIYELSANTLRSHVLAHLCSGRGFKPRALKIRPVDIHVPGRPSPQTVLQIPALGTDGKDTRTLPVDVFTNVSIQTRKGPSTTAPLVGELKLYTCGGRGDYAGSCRIEYTILRLSKDDSGTSWTVLRAQDLPPTSDRDADLQRQKTRTVMETKVLPGLWDLEREVYGEEADKVQLLEEGRRTRRGKKRLDAKCGGDQGAGGDLELAALFESLAPPGDEGPVANLGAVGGDATEGQGLETVSRFESRR